MLSPLYLATGFFIALLLIRLFKNRIKEEIESAEGDPVSIYLLLTLVILLITLGWLIIIGVIVSTFIGYKLLKLLLK